jgi:hypothetical protein
MKTTYFLTHESDTCPICGKLLRESRYYDEVACSDPQCRFNRLAAYEDSGLSPEEVQELAKAKEGEQI